MSNADVDQTKTTATDPGAPSPTLTYYGQIAAQLSASLAAFVAAVPDFEIADAPDERFLNRKRQVPKAFIGTAIGAAVTSDELKSVPQLNTDRSLERSQYIDAFKPLHDQLIVVEKTLGFSIKVKEALLAADAQKIYEVAKGLARNRDGGEIVTHVQNMKRDLGNRKHRAKRKQNPAKGDPTPSKKE